MTTTTTSPHPEQGQMVSVRSRNWMVTDVSASTLPPERLQTGLEPPQHLLTLSSVEDDGLGEELNVIWELEPGARVIEKVALPDPTGFDPPDRLDAFLDAVRWALRPRQTCARSRPRSAPASTSRTTNSTPWCGRSRCHGSISWSPTTWASARLSRRAWWRSNSSSGTALEKS